MNHHVTTRFCVTGRRCALRIVVWGQLLFLAITAQGATDHYAAPRATRQSDGTRNKPWDLAFALRSTAIRPGDTLWLSGGLYQGNFVSNLHGTEGSPITIRALPGERVTIDASGLHSALMIRGAWTTWWGLEFMNSHAKRKTDQGGSFPSDIAFGSAINIDAPHTKLINLIVHDHGNGICAMSTAPDSEIYGCLIYNNGWQGPDRGHGDGVVSQNRQGMMHFVDNILFNQFSMGFQIYGTKQSMLRGFHLAGNVVFNNGAVSRDGVTTNIWIGGGATAEQVTVTDNYTYNSVPWGVHLHAGSGADNKELRVTGNYFPGYCRIQNWRGATVTDNLIAGKATVLEWIRVSEPSNIVWDRNRYHSLEESYLPFGLNPNGGLFDFEGWKRETGFDANSQYTKGLPHEMRVALRVNRYEPGRAHVVVYNWGRTDTVQLNASQVLSNGDKYEVRNAQDYFAPPVLSGTYDGSSLSLPMRGLAVVKPFGHDPEVAPTGPEFNVFVLTRLPRAGTTLSSTDKQ